jgi:hypothetical protein
MKTHIRTIMFGVLLALPLGARAQATQPTPGPATQPTDGTAMQKGVTFVSVNGNTPGRMATVTVQASANSECSISYRTPSGTASKAAGLTPKITDSNGKVSWSWLIGARTKSGTGTITVTCHGETGSADITIE